MRVIRILCSVLILIIFFILSISCNNEDKLRHNSSDLNKNKVSKRNKIVFEENWEFYGKLRKKYQIEDKLVSKLISRPPRSTWFESEKSFYQKIFEKKQFDVLVVPFQTQSYGLDHVERILMSYKLAITIEQNTNLKVAPLHLIYPSLGILQRYYNEDEVYALAKKLKISRIIWCYAGTQNDSNETSIQLSYSIIDEKFPFIEKKREVGCKKWTDIIIEPHILPYQVFTENINTLMTFLNLPLKRKSATVVLDESKHFAVPSSPSELLSISDNNILLRSYYLQFLAMIAPADYQKTYLFTRSITNLFQLEDSSPDRKLIEARAFLHLYRRPAAMKMLEGPVTLETEALQHYANANLPELRAKLKELKPSIKRLLAELEFFYLEDEYKKEMTDSEIEEYIKQYPDWSYFLKKHLAHYDVWEISSNIELKQLLDKYLPVDNFSLENIAVGRVITARKNADLTFELLFQDHIYKAIADRKEKIANTTNLSGSTLDLDFLFMAESCGLSNLIQMIRIPGFTQDLPEKGIQICDEILKFYKDHPYFTCMKFTLLYNLIDGSSEIIQKNMMQEIYDLSLKTMWWNGRQNWIQRISQRYIKYLFETRKIDLQAQNQFILNKDMEKCIGMDYPFRVINIKPPSYRPWELMLPWVHTEIKIAIQQYFHTPYQVKSNKLNKGRIITRSSIFSEIQSRFNGHPEKSKFIINQSVEKDKTIDKKELLLTTLKKGSGDWKLYKELAGLYIAENSYDEAKSILLKYPRLVPPYKDNRVATSNCAASAGNLFFNRGAIEHAKYFYEICENLDTGSARCMEGQEKLALLRGNYVTASKYSLAKARRYNLASDYANLMTYLHLQGKHTMAWSIFKDMITNYAESHAIWTSALIGHRMEGRNNNDIILWLNELSSIAKTNKQKSYLSRFGCLWLMDRNFDKGIIEEIHKLDVPVPFYYYRIKLEPTFIKKESFPYTAFSKGYGAFLNGQFSEAYKSFSKMFTRRPDGYLAYAAVMSGSKDDYIRRNRHWNQIPRNPTYSDFDKLLATAVLKCFENNHNDAILNLKKAYAVRPPTIDDPQYTKYYLLEICELLYKTSGEPMYLELLLLWSRAYQTTAPMFAWAYAIEAKYTTNPKDRLRSLAFAQFLDPNSIRLMEFKQDLRDKAKKWFEYNNPFSKNKADMQGV